MTKTSQLNEMAIMIYDGGCLVLKNINSLFFAIILMKNHMIEMKMKKKIVLLQFILTDTYSP